MRQHGKHGSKLRLLNHLVLPIEASHFSRVWVSARWLDTKQKRIPVVFVDDFGEGFGGQVFFFVFSKGLNRKPVDEEFTWTHNIGHSDSGLDFSGVDERGFMTVRDYYREGALEPSPQDVVGETIWVWDGKDFVEKKEKEGSSQSSSLPKKTN